MVYVIYRDSWRRGGDGTDKNLLSKFGPTSLYNQEHYVMCCLGQCSVEAGVPLELIRDVAEPYEIDPFTAGDYELDKDHIRELLLKGGLLAIHEETGKIISGDFVGDAIDINDDADISEELREQKLIELGQDHGHIITFVDGIAPWFNPKGWEAV